MNNSINFRTSMFDVSQEKENPYNPIYGVSLLLWLKEELKGKMEMTEPDAEDWGWYSELEWEGKHYMIGSTAFFEEGDDPKAESDWAFQIVKFRSFKERLFGKNKMTESDSCFLYFKELFDQHPQIHGVSVE